MSKDTWAVCRVSVRTVDGPLDCLPMIFQIVWVHEQYLGGSWGLSKGSFAECRWSWLINKPGLAQGFMDRMSIALVDCPRVHGQDVDVLADGLRV